MMMMMRVLVQVWPFLLGYYKFGSSESSRQQQDESAHQQYEHSMSEWLAIEAIITQRDRETATAPPTATEGVAVRHKFSESQDVDLPAAKIELFRNNSSLSNDVFESIDGLPAGVIAGCDEASRPETVIEESSSTTTPTIERSSVATEGGGLPELGVDGSRNLLTSSEYAGELLLIFGVHISICCNVTHCIVSQFQYSTIDHFTSFCASGLSAPASGYRTHSERMFAILNRTNKQTPRN